MVITKDLFEKAVVTLWSQKKSKDVVIGTTVYAWLLQQGGNPVPMHKYEKEGKSPYMMKIVDITADQNCELLPLIKGFHLGHFKFNDSLLGILKHNFKGFLDFWSACHELGIFAVQDNPQHWYGYYSGLRVEFLPNTGRFSFRIPTGTAGFMIPYMAKCSLLMTAAYRDAA